MKEALFFQAKSLLTILLSNYFSSTTNPLKTKGFHTTPSLTTPPHPVVEVVRDGVVYVLWVGLVVVVCGGLGSSSNVNIDF